MKLQVILALSAAAAVTAQAAAEPAPLRYAAASVSVSAEAAPAPPQPVAASALPAASAAVNPSAVDEKRARSRPVRRAASQRQQQPQPQRPATWQERMRAMWGLDNPPAGPGAAQPNYPRNPGYTSRPNNRLLFGRFYTRIPRQTVAFPGNHAPGTIIVRHSERRLYYVLGNGQAIRYAVAVGREGAAWSGTSTVSNKREWPSWTPTPAILRRQPNLPRHMEGGPQNPMGARALYLGDTLYRIHGTNEPWTIGEEVSSGCIRMTNEDVIDLYNRTRLGARVIVQR